MFSNYSIKRMIPRLIVAAILVNVSFWITALAVDLSNLLGYNLQALFGNFDINPTGNVGTAGGLWTEIMGAVLLVGGIALLVIAIALAPTALLAFGVVILILVARKALIVLLIVLAPIAFVAYLLPNTEDLFKKWYKMFFALLMVFPIVSVVFGASKLASDILLSISQSDPDDTQLLMKLTAVAVLAVPLFAVPSLLMGSLKAAGAIGAKLEGLSNRTNKYAGKKAMQGRIGEAKMAFDARQKANRINRRLNGGYIGRGRVGQYIARKGAERGNTPSGKMLRMIGAPGKQVDNSRFARALGADRGAAAATAAYNKEAREEMDRQEQTMSSMDFTQLQAIVENESLSDERRSAAASTIAKRGADKEVQKMIDYVTRAKKKARLEGNASAGESLTNIQQLSAGDVLKRNIGGWGSTKKNEYARGYAESDGYLQDLVKKLQDGSMGAEGLSKLGIDDHIRLAQLSRDDDLGDEDRKLIKKYLDDIDRSDTMHLDDRARNVINQTIAGKGDGPGGKIVGMDGTDLDRSINETTKLEYKPKKP